MVVVSKVLRKMEVLRGFIQIPAKSLPELVGNFDAPYSTLLNDNPAEIDKYGRLWSPAFLKNKFAVRTKIELRKTENGFQVTSNETQGNPPNRTEDREDAAMPSFISEKKSDIFYKVLEGDCVKYLEQGAINDINMTFLDPPYRQGKDYRFFDDNQPASEYWGWLKEILQKAHEATVNGGAVYFMQREKNTEQVLRVLRKTGWKFQNLIVWKKKTSAVPINSCYSKQYQIIAYAIKGEKPKVFNKLRIDLPPLPEHKYERENGVYVTDVWDDIREMTSGYFAGDEAIRDPQGNRAHVQQSPVALLLRMILSSTLPGDTVLDPLAGTGTTSVVAHQLGRNSIAIEIDPKNVEIIKKRLKFPRPSDDVSKQYDYYRFTPNLKEIWRLKGAVTEQRVLS